MDEAIEIDIRLTEKEINAAADRIERKLKAALGPLFGGGPGAGRDPITPRLRDQEAAALRLAQAQARLATVNGNLSQAQNILSTALARTTKETVAQVNAQTQLVRTNQQLERSTQQTAGGVNSLGSAVSAVRGSLAALGAFGIASLFQSFARSALDAAISVDKQVNSLRALTGSAEAAQKRFQELFKIAQQTPGLTSTLATTLDAQLRVFNVNQRTIDRLLPTIGRLNAISPINDPRQFVNNLTQLISQNFERQDLKELVGQSPIAGKLIAEIFNVDNPTNAAAIRASAKRLGITTVERLAEELAKAGENNSALRNATESLGGQFEKLQDRITVALAPIGDQIGKVVMPAFQALVSEFEDSGPIITNIIKENAREMEAFGIAIASTGELAAGLVSVFSGLDRQSGIVRDLAVLLTAVGNPIQLSSIQAIFQRIDENRLKAAAARRSESFVPGGRIDFAEESTAAAEAYARFLKRRTGGLGGGGAASARQRGITFPALTADELVSSQFEGIDDFNAIEAARARGREVRRALTLDAEADRRRLINEGRDTRRRLTVEADAQAIAEQQRLARRDLGRSGRFIDDAFNRGQITPADAQALAQAANRQYAASLSEIIASEEKRAQLGAARVEDLQDEIELYDRLGSSISDAERFMRGFNSATISVGDAFERFGQNVSQALTNTKDLLSGLKQALLSFFNDLLGSSLQNLMRQTLAPLLGSVAGAFGGPSFAGAAGNIFRTPSTFPAAIAQAFAGDGGISVPASITSSAGGLPIFRGNLPVSVPIANASGGVLAQSAAKPGFFSSLGSSLASAAPFLGLGLGSGLGGQSTAGGILGAAGGFLGGGAVAGFSGALSAGAKAFFTNPFTIAIGAGLLVGSFFLGRAQQRRKDEELSGQYLTQAMQGIQELASGVSSGQIDVSQARQIFDAQILGTFRQQISGLQTKSVRESRLTNQVRDLEGMYKALVEPAIAQQIQQRRDAARFAAIDSRLVPQFASGGFVPGINRGFDSVVARLTPGELVLNQAQQDRVMAMAGPSVFDRAGVPSSPIYTGAFAGGGYAQSSAPAAINLSIRLGMGKGDALEILASATDSRTGQRILVNAVEEEMGRRSN